MTGKRFKEIISTQKVIDTQTGKEYDCLIDNDLFDLINIIAEENEQLKQENQELHKLNQEYVDSLSDEKKETLSEMLNTILGDDVE